MGSALVPGSANARREPCVSWCRSSAARAWPTPTRIMAAARRAIRAKQAGDQVLVVVSARGDKTDELIELAQQISEQPPAREMDMLLATGEQESIALLAMAIHTLGERAISFTGAQVGIVTDRTHTKARIKGISTERMRRALDDGQIVIVAGFQGMDEDFNITTLGRGGSDTTAVALAAVMKHDPGNGGEPRPLEIRCEIYTDVDGVYTTDPRVVPEARKIDWISYDEMLELASAGAGVMHSRSIEFAKKFDVPIQVRSSFSDVEGTWIIPEADWMSQVPVCGAALVRDEARVAILGVPDQPGISHRVFEAVASRSIVVDMIAQNVGSGGRAAIGFTVPEGELRDHPRRPGAAGERVGRQRRIRRRGQQALDRRRGHARARRASPRRCSPPCAAENINLKMITTADIKISVLVERKHGLRALRAVHQAFGLASPRPGAGVPDDGHEPADGRHGPRHAGTPAPAVRHGGHPRHRTCRLDTTQGRITLSGLPDQPGPCSRRLPGGRLRRHRRRYDRPEPHRRPAASCPSASPAPTSPGRPSCAPGRATADRPGRRGRRRRRDRHHQRPRRRHADAHRRRPPDVRRAGPARHQHRHDQHQRGPPQRRRRTRPRRGGVHLPPRGVPAPARRMNSRLRILTPAQESPDVPPPIPLMALAILARRPVVPARRPGPEARRQDRRLARSSAAPSATTSRRTRACSRSGPRTARSSSGRAKASARASRRSPSPATRSSRWATRTRSSHVFALDRANGKPLWSAKVGKAGGNYDGTRCTPTVDGKLVYAIGQFGDLVCLDTDEGRGEVAQGLQQGLRRAVSGGWNYSESPLVDGDRLVCTPGGAKATMVALDKRTGKEIWRSPGGDTARAIRRSSSPTPRA